MRGEAASKGRAAGRGGVRGREAERANNAAQVAHRQPRLLGLEPLEHHLLLLADAHGHKAVDKVVDFTVSLGHIGALFVVHEADLVGSVGGSWHAALSQTAALWLWLVPPGDWPKGCSGGRRAETCGRGCEGTRA